MVSNHLKDNNMTIRIIAAVSKNGVIGKDNALPFDYPEDLKWFRKSTVDSNVIMGRKTFEGIGKPLPKRRNFVITRSQIDGVISIPSIQEAFDIINTTSSAFSNTWFIGGASIYEEGMNWAQEIYLTLTPDKIEGEDLVRFPWINPSVFNFEKSTPLDQLVDMSDYSDLSILTYKRRI